MPNTNPHPPPPPPPPPPSPITTLSPSEYTTTLTTTAITTILHSLGFKSSKPSALQTLTRITTLFLHSLTTSAASRATSCHRTHPNLFDLISAIELLSLPPGFSGASSINQPLMSSSTIDDLRYFIHHLPLRRSLKLPSLPNPPPEVIFSGCCGGGGGLRGRSRGNEIPIWLPPFPEIVKEFDDDDDDYGKGKGRRECLWEDEKEGKWAPVRAEKSKEKGGIENVMMLGRRQRVKFKFIRRRKSLNLSGFDDLALRNGVFRGGKRVCLIKKVDDITTVFQFDDDDDDKDCNLE